MALLEVARPGQEATQKEKHAFSAFLNRSNSYGQTALMLACKNGYILAPELVSDKQLQHSNLPTCGLPACDCNLIMKGLHPREIKVSSIAPDCSNQRKSTVYVVNCHQEMGDKGLHHCLIETAMQAC